MLNFAKLLKEEREKQGLSQRELARKAGCTGRIISYWEAGKKVPSIDLANKVLEVLGVTLILGKEKEG